MRLGASPLNVGRWLFGNKVTRLKCLLASALLQWDFPEWTITEFWGSECFSFRFVDAHAPEDEVGRHKHDDGHLVLVLAGRYLVSSRRLLASHNRPFSIIRAPSTSGSVGYEPTKRPARRTQPTPPDATLALFECRGCQQPIANWSRHYFSVRGTWCQLPDVQA
jgi:hypothetical protein